MPQFLNSSAPDFEDQFARALSAKREDAPDVDEAVAAIIADVRARGDAAVIELTARFDRMDLTPGALAVSPKEIEAACAQVSAEERAALELAAARIRAYHERQLPTDEMWEDASGATLGWRWTPVSAAGLYVPGGLASYPSSVLMNAIPAQVAGVPEMAICAPTPGGEVNPLVLLAAHLSGVRTVYRIGGAQAIAALAYGTETIRPVDKITGPGNAYVAAAKRRVFGAVGIDMIAGPSEILVIADADNDPDWIAIDLLSQAEHDESAQAILITTDQGFGQAVADAVARRLQSLERKAIAGASWQEFGLVITVRDLDEAARLSDRIAPEHLELCVADPTALMAKITHAGAIFLGSWTPEAIGDYVGGPNHVLPTARTARFSSGLSVLDFMKRTTIAQMTPQALAAIGPAAETLARSESLEAHGLSVRARLERLNDAPPPLSPGSTLDMDPPDPQSTDDMSRIAHIEIDDSALPPPTPEIEQERRVAIFDLLEDNSFVILPRDGRDVPDGPYHLLLAIRDKRLVLDVTNENGAPVAEIQLALGPFRQVVKDYFQICESYFDAVKKLPPSQIEAIDMARRGIHNEGARVLQERLEGKATTDVDTSRRLFTLICVLHFGG